MDRLSDRNRLKKEKEKLLGESYELREFSSPEKSPRKTRTNKSNLILSIHGTDSNNTPRATTIQQSNLIPQSEEGTFGFLTNNILTNNFIVNFSKKKIFGLLGLPNTFDKLNYYSKWWKFYDNAVNLLNLTVIIFVVYNYDLNYEYPRKVDNDIETTKLIILILACINVFCMIRRHMIKKKWRELETFQKENFEEENAEDFLFEESSFSQTTKTKLLSTGFIIDVIIILIIPYPYIDFIIELKELDRDNNKYIPINYLFSDFLSLLLLLRIIHFVRAGINYSMFTNLYTHTVAKQFNVKINIRYALKCIIKTQHIKIVLAFFAFSVIVLGYALRICERPFNSVKEKLEFESYINSFYCIFVTMLTIGYGDFYPNTRLGKVVVTIAGLWGVFITSLIIVCLYGLLDLSQDQFLVFVKVIKSQVAAKFIESAWKFRLKKREGLNAREEYSDLKDIYSEFKGMRNESKSIYRSNGTLYYNMKLLSEIKKLNKRFDKLEDDLEANLLNSKLTS